MSKRPSYELQKIARALEEECRETKIAIEHFLVLSPIEKRNRLKDRMKKWRLKDCEIPDERTFRDFWKRLKSVQGGEVDTPQGGFKATGKAEASDAKCEALQRQSMVVAVHGDAGARRRTAV